MKQTQVVQTTGTFNVESGYANERGKMSTVRVMTFEDVMNRKDYGMLVLDKNGKMRHVKINGATKTWKTRPRDCRIPYKYGMYEFGYIEFKDGELTASSPTPVMIAMPIE